LEKPDHRHRRLLRARRERPRGRRAAEKRDELAAVHSITSSARASTLGGTHILAHRPSEKKRIADPTKRCNHHRRIVAVCCPELGEFIQ
jgi:hypothetical protein